MNIEGIKGSIDLSTENVFNQLDALEGRLNKFAQSRGNDGEIIANEMKTIVNVMAGSQIEFADNLKKAFDALEQQHIKYGQKARRIEKDVTKALVAEMVNRNQAFAQSYAQTQMDYLTQLNKTNAAYEALTKSKIADRADRADYRETQRVKQAELEADKLISDQADEIFMRSKAQMKAKQQAIDDQAEARMIEFRASKKASEEAARVEIKNQKAQEAAMKASLEKRRKMFISFGKGIASIAKGIVWFPVIANQTMQMFQGVGYTLKSIWDGTYGMLIRANAELENYTVRLKSVTGSYVLAQAVFEDVFKYAVETTYTISEAMQGATSLLPVLKNNREELKKLIPVVGDLAATFGLSFEEATGNIIKVIGGGIAAADLFRDRGISGALGFKANTKYSGAESMEKLYEEYEKKTSLFRGAAKELFFTWDGTVSKIQDKWIMFLKDIGDAGIFRDLKIALNFISDRFEALQSSGEGYEKIVKAISDSMTDFLRKLLAAFEVLSTFFLKLLPEDVQKGLQDAFKSKDQIEMDGLLAQRAALEKQMLGEQGKTMLGLPEDTEAINKIAQDLKAMDEQIKTLGANTKETTGQIKSFFSMLNLNSALDTAAIVGNKYNTEFATPAAFNFGKKDANSRQLREDADKFAEEERKAKEIADATSAALDKVKDNLAKANLETIKYTRGEWAAFVEETRIEANKLGEKVSASMAKSGQDGGALATGVVGEYFKTTLAGKIAEYKNELEELTRSAKTELKSIGMTDSEKSKSELSDEYDSIHFKDLPSSLRESKEAAYNAELAVIHANEQAKSYNETLEYQSTIRSASIPGWNAYAQEMEKINLSYQQSAYWASRAKEEEAARNKQRSIDILNANTIADANNEISNLEFELSKFGKTDFEQKIAEINRQFRYLTDKNNPIEIQNLGKSLVELNKSLDAKNRLTTYADGWTSAMTEIKDEMLTDGMVIKNFMTDVFSELSSTLSDVFFNVFKGELKSAAEAFEGFADAIMKSIADIMANQIASQIMSGGMSMLGNFFTMHSGGIVGKDYTSRKKVNPLVFAGAPRFHSGLLPSEFPAILEKGEMVIPKDGWKSGSSGGGVAVSIKNESGQELKVTKAKTNQDISGMVIEIVLDGINRNVGGLRSAFGR